MKTQRESELLREQLLKFDAYTDFLRIGYDPHDPDHAHQRIDVLADAVRTLGQIVRDHAERNLPIPVEIGLAKKSELKG